MASEFRGRADRIDWSAELSAVEIEHIADAAEDDKRVAFARPDMTAQFSDDIVFVYRQVRVAEERNIAIEAAMWTAQEAGDGDAYDAACEAFDVAYDELVVLERRLLDLENIEGRGYEREVSGWYYATR